MSVGYFIILRDRRFRLQVHGALRALLASACMGVVVWLLRGYGLFIPLIAGGVVYAIALVAVGGIRRAELMEIMRGSKPKEIA